MTRRRRYIVTSSHRSLNLFNATLFDPRSYPESRSGESRRRCSDSPPRRSSCEHPRSRASRPSASARKNTSSRTGSARRRSRNYDTVSCPSAACTRRRSSPCRSRPEANTSTAPCNATARGRSDTSSPDPTRTPSPRLYPRRRHLSSRGCTRGKTRGRTRRGARTVGRRCAAFRARPRGRCRTRPPRSPPLWLRPRASCAPPPRTARPPARARRTRPGVEEAGRRVVGAGTRGAAAAAAAREGRPGDAREEADS
eukprot:29091-Pelagococcus_subviridis.AAC.6